MAHNLSYKQKMNNHAVVIFDGGIRICKPPTAKQTMTKGEALVLAAWLVRLADNRADEFPGIIREVRGISKDLPRG